MVMVIKSAIYLSLVVVVCVVSVTGCNTMQRLEVSSSREDASALLPPVQDIDATTRPRDRFEEHAKLGRINASLEERRRAAADVVLEQVRARLPSLTPEQLLAGLRTSEPTNAVAYYVWRDGNIFIERELRRRGNAAAAALIAHSNDERRVWTGGSGENLKVGQLCERILGEGEKRQGE